MNPEILRLAIEQTPARKTGERQEDYEARIGFKAVQLMRLASPASIPGRVVEAYQRAVDSEKPFPATVTQVVQEPNTKRFLVDLFTGTERVPDLPDGAPALAPGCERIRTEPSYHPEGRLMGKYARSLIGHKVLAFKEVESFDRGNGVSKVRVLRWLDDLGPDSRAQFTTGPDGAETVTVTAGK